jgi:hypothetical protein
VNSNTCFPGNISSERRWSELDGARSTCEISCLSQRNYCMVWIETRRYTEEEKGSATVNISSQLLLWISSSVQLWQNVDAWW